MTDLGNELARLRREKDLSQQELADILRVSRQAVSRWENGTAIPTMENMIFLARLHDVQLDELVDGRKEGSGGEWRTAEPRRRSRGGALGKIKRDGRCFSCARLRWGR